MADGDVTLTSLTLAKSKGRRNKSSSHYVKQTKWKSQIKQSNRKHCCIVYSHCSKDNIHITCIYIVSCCPECALTGGFNVQTLLSLYSPSLTGEKIFLLSLKSSSALWTWVVIVFRGLLLHGEVMVADCWNGVLGV